MWAIYRLFDSLFMLLQETPSIIQTVASIVAIIVGITGVILALRAEYRNNKRFETQFKLQTETAKASVKPILATYTSEFADVKAVTLYNFGSGIAVITGIAFSKEGKAVNNLANLFELGKVSWDMHWTFAKVKAYLKAGEKIILVKLAAESLIKQGYSREEAFKILERWQEQLNGIEVKITYEDILGNIQPDYKMTYKS